MHYINTKLAGAQQAGTYASVSRNEFTFKQCYNILRNVTDNRCDVKWKRNPEEKEYQLRIKLTDRNVCPTDS